MRSQSELIKYNVGVHDKVAAKYDALHGEIFNDVEQRRLADTLRRALDGISTASLKALDFGCGSGNLTRHLLALGAQVVAADVSPKFLELVNRRFGVKTLLLNGRDLSDLPSESFDIVAAYSVLHHIPDYHGALREIARVCRPGGVVYLDHEPTEGYWVGDPTYTKYRKLVERSNWRKFIRPSNYVHKVIRLFDPRHTNEGDIHVWTDDHIEWKLVANLLTDLGFKAIIDEDYLLYRTTFRLPVYMQFHRTLTDMKVMVFRKL